MILLTSIEAWALCLGIVFAVIILCYIICRLLGLKRVKEPAVSINVTEVLEAVGGIANIKSVKAINKRLAFELIDLRIDGEALKRITGNGVFITGNTLKILVNGNLEAWVLEVNKELGSK